MRPGLQVCRSASGSGQGVQMSWDGWQVSSSKCWGQSVKASAHMCSLALKHGASCACYQAQAMRSLSIAGGMLSSAGQLLATAGCTEH